MSDQVNECSEKLSKIQSEESELSEQIEQEVSSKVHLDLKSEESSEE
jgi:hypothetical protein